MAQKADQIVVESAPRDTRGKNEARRLRQTGKVPAVLYGGKSSPITLSVNAKQVSAILRSPTGHNTLFQVSLGGKSEPAIVKDWLADPITGAQLHVGDLPIDSAKIKLLTEPERVIAHVVALKVEEEKPAEVVAAEGAAPAEPEVIKKGKKEVEGEEGAEAGDAKSEKADKPEKGEKKEKK